MTPYLSQFRRNRVSKVHSAGHQAAVRHGRPGRRFRRVASGELLGEVFGQVADASFGVAGSSEHTLGVELRAEPGNMQRLILRADGVERLIPSGEQLAGLGVEVPAGGFVPGRKAVAVVFDGARIRPPDLVVGGDDDLAQVGSGDGDPECDVDVHPRSASTTVPASPRMNDSCRHPTTDPRA